MEVEKPMLTCNLKNGPNGNLPKNKKRLARRIAERARKQRIENQNESEKQG